MNNTTSCLLNDIKQRGLIDIPNYGKITYIADNCGGQSKNMAVVRFLMWLVEAKIFRKVTLLFLAKGHIKNAADRMFNLLKLTYHFKDIFIYDELHRALSENKFVTVIKMSPQDFHGHAKWQNQYYSVPAVEEFKQSHMFTINGTGQGA